MTERCPVTARLRARPPAWHQHDGEIGRVVVGFVGERDHLRFCHGATLDIDGAGKAAAALQRAAQFRQMPADFHHHRSVGVGEPSRQFAFRQRRWQHGKNIIALRNRRSHSRPAA